MGKRKADIRNLGGKWSKRRLEGLIPTPLYTYKVPGLLFGISLLTVWQILWLGYIPETDLAIHAASILNFKDAFFNGQYLPRLQLPPASLPDLPTFQFYGSLMGYLSLPFLIAGCKPIVALTLSVLLIRWIGAMAIYRIGRLLSANVLSSSLASIAFLLSPYIISNFYGRAAIPESTAHGVIAVLLYGVISLFLRADMTGVVVTSLAIVALSLAHPIFLLFGCLVAAVFSLLLLRGRFLLLVGGVFLGALLLASFQWLPGFLYRGDFALNFATFSPFQYGRLTSLSGLIGLPHSLAQEGLSVDEKWLYLTPGIFTIPILIMLSFKIKEPLGRATFGCLLLLLIASYSPFDFWRFLPSLFWALQFPYRLLAFVALLTSIGICLTLKKLRFYQWALLTAVLLVQSAGIVVQKPYSIPLSIDADVLAVKELKATQDYAWKTSPLPVKSTDGWLLHYSAVIYSVELHALAPQVVDARGMLLKENTFAVGISPSPETFIRVTGRIAESGLTQPYSLWLGHSSSPLTPLDGTRFLNGKTFSVLFRIPNDGRSLTVQCGTPTNFSQTKGLQQKCPDIHLDSLEYLPANSIVVSKALSESTNLNIDGASIFPNTPVDLWLAAPSSPDLPLTGKVTVGPGPFSSSLRLPKDRGLYMLVASRYLVPALEMPGSTDYRRLSVSIQHYNIVEGEVAPIIVPFESVARIKNNGYKRIFKVKNSELISSLPDKAHATVQLPMAFSPMIEVTQNGTRLITKSTDRGLISALTSDLSSPFVARFRWPVLALFGALFGIVILTFIAWRARQTVHDPCSGQWTARAREKNQRAGIFQ